MDVSVLEAELAKVIDKENPEFVGFSKNQLVVAENWANAIDTYAAEIIPATTAVASGAARQAFIPVMAASAAPSAAIAAFPQAFTAYAAQVATGMTSGAIVSTPPPAPIVIAPIFPIGLSGNTPLLISTFASIIDTWFRTGTYTVSGGAPIFWGVAPPTSNSEPDNGGGDDGGSSSGGIGLEP